MDLADHLHDNFNASQADEECFRYMKNSKVIKGKRRSRRPEKAMAVVLAKEVLSKVMKYKEVEVDGLLPDRSVKLSKEAFQGLEKNNTLPFHEIVSTKENAPFYNPGAVNWSQPAADLPLIRAAFDERKWHHLQNAWISTFVQAKHRIILWKGDTLLGFAT